ncbi:MAG: hypothetical protein ACKN8Z_03505, partial [Polynucleobacter sp.]
MVKQTNIVILLSFLGSFFYGHAVAKNVSPVKIGENQRIEAPISDADKTFIELRDAARKNDIQRTQQLSGSLSNYPYLDYVRYFQLKPQMFDKGNEARADSSVDDEVRAFISTYDGSAIADRMRNDWLLVLGKRKDWNEFDREYPKFVLDDDTNVKCYSLQSRLSKNEDPKAIGQEALKIMIDPRQFGSACQELVPALVQVNGLSTSQARVLGRSAAEMNFETAGRR